MWTMTTGTTSVAAWAIRKNMSTSLMSVSRSPVHRAPLTPAGLSCGRRPDHHPGDRSGGRGYTISGPARCIGLPEPLFGAVPSPRRPEQNSKNETGDADEEHCDGENGDRSGVLHGQQGSGDEVPEGRHRMGGSGQAD
jgi:hypothetical protein